MSKKSSQKVEQTPTSEKLVENMINLSLNESKAQIKQRIASIPSIQNFEPSKVDVIS
jgi:hypothetical protein